MFKIKPNIIDNTLNSLINLKPFFNQFKPEKVLNVEISLGINKNNNAYTLNIIFENTSKKLKINEDIVLTSGFNTDNLEVAYYHYLNLINKHKTDIMNTIKQVFQNKYILKFDFKKDVAAELAESFDKKDLKNVTNYGNELIYA